MLSCYICFSSTCSFLLDFLILNGPFLVQKRYLLVHLLLRFLSSLRFLSLIIIYTFHDLMTCMIWATHRPHGLRNLCIVSTLQSHIISLSLSMYVNMHTHTDIYIYIYINLYIYIYTCVCVCKCMFPNAVGCKHQILITIYLPLGTSKMMAEMQHPF